MNETNDKYDSLINEVKNLTLYAEEIENMRRLRDAIMETSAENPTAMITIESIVFDGTPASVNWMLGIDGDARIHRADPIFPPKGLTGKILKCLDEDIRQDEKTLSDLVAYCRKDLDDTLLPEGLKNR